MRYLGTLLVGLVMISLARSQRYQAVLPEDGQYFSELYEYDPESRPVQPTARSYGSTPAERQQAAGPKQAPVAILKQINRHNEDGSYTYGFEGADGSFKIETKSPNGDVKGKYGFVDDSGKVRVVEYGADKYGFQPSGDGITVAPPTLVDETTGKDAINDYDNYQQQPAPRPIARPIASPKQHQPVYQPQYQTAHPHTQAIYSKPALPKPAIFEPAGRPSALAALQSQLIQPAYYSDQPSYKTGPVQFSPAPVQEVRPQPQPRGGPSPSQGLLDQLARDYALPQNAAAPLHDISFGYY